MYIWIFKYKLLETKFSKKILIFFLLIYFVYQIYLFIFFWKSRVWCEFERWVFYFISNKFFFFFALFKRCRLKLRLILPMVTLFSRGFLKFLWAIWDVILRTIFFVFDFFFFFFWRSNWRQIFDLGNPWIWPDRELIFFFFLLCCEEQSWIYWK